MLWQVAASKKVSEFEGDDHPYSIRGTRFHTDHVNLGIGMIQVAIRESTEDFCGRLADGRDLVRPSIKVGQTWASCRALIDKAQYIKLLQRM